MQWLHTTQAQAGSKTKESIGKLQQGMSTLRSVLRILSKRIRIKHLRSQRQWARFYNKAAICKACLTHTGHMAFLMLLLSSSTAQAATASWYSVEACKVNPDPACPTASGKSLYQLEKDNVDFAASYRFPLGTRVKVSNANTGQSVVVRILDRGPHRRLNREIDLGKRAFEKIADTRSGLIPVSLEVLK